MLINRSVWFLLYYSYRKNIIYILLKRERFKIYFIFTEEQGPKSSKEWLLSTDIFSEITEGVKGAQKI